MGFTEVLTIIFIVLKLLGVIDWSWFLVLLPEIIAFGFYVVIWVIIGSVDRKIEDEFDKLTERTKETKDDIENDKRW